MNSPNTSLDVVIKGPVAWAGSNFKWFNKRGKKVPNKLENIIRIGIILSDKKEGPFELEIDYIEFN